VLPESVLRLDRIVEVADDLSAVPLQPRPPLGEEQLPTDLHPDLHPIDLPNREPITGYEVPRVERVEDVLVVPADLTAVPARKSGSPGKYPVSAPSGNTTQSPGAARRSREQIVSRFPATSRPTRICAITTLTSPPTSARSCGELAAPDR
jgi:hypothetical protein